jgi:hypothetical protein
VVREKVSAKDRPQEFLQDLVTLIGQIIRVKVAVAGKRGPLCDRRRVDC